MLACLGNEMELYNRDAALYFAYILEAPTRSRYSDEVINQGAPMPSLEFLNLECDKHQQRIEDYSAGLLELDDITVGLLGFNKTDKSGTGLRELQWARYELGALGKSAEDVKSLVEHLRKFDARQGQGIHFIHRTAADLLLESTEGQ